MNGYYTVYLYRTTQAVDGSRAFRVFFICHERNHLSLVGYTKPVDFVLNKGEINNEDAINSRSFAEEEEEEEQEWNEAVEFARRVKDNTKKYF